MAELERETPARKAIRLLGVKSLAWKCDLTSAAIYKWDNEEGLIPAKHQPAVLALAREKGVDLTADDIIPQAA